MKPSTRINEIFEEKVEPESIASHIYIRALIQYLDEQHEKQEKINKALSDMFTELFPECSYNPFTSLDEPSVS